jgi:hypothetical protein
VVGVAEQVVTQSAETHSLHTQIPVPETVEFHKEFNMSLQYKIRRFNPNFGQIGVEYYTADGLYSQEFSIDLPIKDDNTYPVGEELSALIISLAPTWHYERVVKVLAGVSNSSAIEGLVEPYPQPEVTQPQA